MIDKDILYGMLDRNGIPYEWTDHEAVLTMEGLADTSLPYPDAVAKNIFLTDAGHHAYWLVVLKGNKKLDLSALRKQLGSRRLTMASAEDMREKLSLSPGSVTPMGVLHESAKDVIVLLDEDFLTGTHRIGIHPNDNRATLWLKAEDLKDLLEKQGRNVQILSMPEK